MTHAYQSHDPHAERQRLRLQSEVLEPMVHAALERLEPLEGLSALEVACGAMGALGVLSRRVGPRGRVVGTDINDHMLEMAREYCREHGLSNVELLKDDAYASALSAASFDLVHARFLLAPIGRDAELLPELERLAKPGGWIVVEEPCTTQIFLHPRSDAHERLVGYVMRAYERHMGGFDAGLRLLDHARARGWRDVGLDVRVVGLPPGHPYLRAPVLFAQSLRATILRDTSAAELDAAIAEVDPVYRAPNTFGATYAVTQVWGRPPIGGAAAR